MRIMLVHAVQIGENPFDPRHPWFILLKVNQTEPLS
jgi:hypothetical protein